MPRSSATSRRCRTHVDQPVTAGVVDVPVVGEVLGEPQLGLVGVRRQRPRTVVCVDDEQVDGVGPDVEDPEPHRAPPDVRPCDDRSSVPATYRATDASGGRWHGVPGSPRRRRLWRVPEVPLDFPRAWVEFPDPADAEQAFRCDLTWLTSNWTCIFGTGCKGIYADQPDGVGCCTLGAHFSDKDDEKRVKRLRQAADPGDLAALRPEGLDREGRGGRAQDPGRRRRVHLPEPARLRRRRGLRAARPRAAQGRHFLETKPDVCWQLPIRRTLRPGRAPGRHRGADHRHRRVRPARLGAGGHDLDWYCSGNTEAHVGAEPVYAVDARRAGRADGPEGRTTSW